MGHADHRRLHDVGVRQQKTLDLRREDVEAGHKDDLLGTSGNAQVAGRVEGAEVAGAEPPVVERGGGLLRLAEVARRHVRPADLHLAPGADAEFVVGQRAADGGPGQNSAVVQAVTSAGRLVDAAEYGGQTSGQLYDLQGTAAALLATAGG